MSSNAFVIWLLTSPIHHLISHNTTLLHIRGKQSGTMYHVPVNYIRFEDKLYIVSSFDRTWWRNLRGGAALSLHLRGKNVQGYSNVVADETSVTEMLTTVFELAPGFRRALGVKADIYGTPDPADLLRVARECVVVVIQLGVSTYQPPDLEEVQHAL